MYEMKPFVKWVGGKRQLLTEIQKRLPQKINQYYEPFVGGGAVFFTISSKNATINDINSQLINTYTTIRDSVDDLIRILSKLDSEPCDKERYYQIRDNFNSKIKNGILDVESAALFIYINKRCFNGLYRVNKEGIFNVPYNNKKKGVSFDEKNLREISNYLRGIKILNQDFETVLANAKKGDFVFLDSPYAPLNPQSFESYTKEGFGYEDHIRLAKIFKDLDKRGCKVMLTNHNTNLIQELYREYQIDVIKVKRSINSNADKRTGEEVIIRNYQTKEEVYEKRV